VSVILRKKYIENLLLQEVEYLEKIKVETIPSTIGETFEAIQSSIGQKFSNIIFSMGVLVSGLAIGFIRGPKIAGCIIAFMPLVIVAMKCFGEKVKNATIAKMVDSKNLGGFIEEQLTAVRVVASFAREEQTVKQFD